MSATEPGLNLPSITHGMERYVISTGAEGADMRIRVRYCREEGYLQSSARKSTTPQVELVQAVVMLLVHTVAGVQTTAVERMRKLWHLPLDTREPDWSGDKRPSTAARDSLTGLNAGLAFAAMIEADVSPILGKGKILTPSFPSEFPTISISHKADWIKLWGNRENDVADVWFCAPEARDSVPFGTGHIAKFISSTTILALVLSELANLVRDSRREAFAQGLAIPIENACKVLGSEPPDKDYWKNRLPQPQFLPLDVANVGLFKSEDAGSLAGEPTPSDYQPHDDTQLDTDTPREIRKLSGADHNPCVCLSSTEFGSEVGTSSNRRRTDETPSYYHALC